jgi:uracil-DNA glycosylase
MAELREIVEAGWAEALDPVAAQIAAMGEFLRAEIADGRRYLPAGDNVLRAFKQPFTDVRVLIVGQDPYPTPGHPIGLSFSVAAEVKRLPPSLVNIFREYSEDLGYPTPATGDLTPWTEHGVLLLTIRAWRRARPRSSRSCGAGMPGRSYRYLTGCLASSPPTRAPMRPTGASSAHARSAVRTSCLSSREPSPSTGSCRNRFRYYATLSLPWQLAGDRLISPASGGSRIGLPMTVGKQTMTG